MPEVPQDFIDQMRSLDRRLRQIEGRANIRPAMNQVIGGDVVVGEGGTFKVNDSDGSPMFYVGGISPLNPDGSNQRGLLAYRQDGALALSISNPGVGPMEQTVAVRDHDGNTVVRDDADFGLGRPYLPIPMTPGVEFTDGVWRSTHGGWWQVQNPALIAGFSVYAPPGTTAQARLVKSVSGTITQLGPTITATGSEAFGSFTVLPAEHGMTYGSWAFLVIQAQRTAGTGTCTAWNTGTYGTGT